VAIIERDLIDITQFAAQESVSYPDKPGGYISNIIMVIALFSMGA
jgi:hypothetical protein